MSHEIIDQSAQQPVIQQSEAVVWKRAIAATVATLAVAGLSLEAAAPAAAEESSTQTGAANPLEPITIGARAFVLPSQGYTETTATWNILGSSHPAASRAVGGKIAPTVGARMKRIAEAVNKRQIGIIGFQEVMPDQRVDLKNDLDSNYKLFGDFDSDTAIAVNEDVYTVLDNGIVRVPGYDDSGSKATAKATTVTVENKQTGEVTDVVNVHAVAHNEKPGSDRGGSKKREHTIKILMDWVNKNLRKHPSHRQKIIGDFNSTYKPRTTDKKTVLNKMDGPMKTLAYCKATAGGKLQDAYDAMLGRTGECPTRPQPKVLKYIVDHIFSSRLSPQAGVDTTTKWLVDRSPDTKHTSDHFLLISSETRTPAAPYAAPTQPPETTPAPTPELPPTDPTTPATPTASRS